MNNLSKLLRTEFDNSALAYQLWPDSNPKSRRVLMARWRKEGIKTITLDQVKVLSKFFNLTKIDEL
jgi:hypothetical protein